ncbi:MAG: zinc-binding alcohol dehydrogenase family protein [Caulobacteraceae bacterium]|nr:zinc-binding alcohol dehydrogenase family protein [Caulobacteraceae bacterium]
MRAVGYRTSLPIDDPQALIDVNLPRPRAEGRDLLVEVRAISVNPVDTKVRRRGGPAPGEDVKVLGWDVAGVVVEAGPDARLFKPGDAVWYAGAINRPGANAEFHLVDERIVGRKPASLDFPAAAALPLTTITAWEALFDRLEVRRPVPGAAAAVLIIGGAGGVGSITIQLAHTLTDLTVIATASRPQTRDWCLELGADHVLDHSAGLADQVAALGLGAPGHVFSTTHTDSHLPEIVKLVAPQGKVALIDDPASLDANSLKGKSLSLHWEAMFARSLFQTADMEAQHALLDQVADMVDEGRIRTTLTEVFGTINAANLRRAHAQIESGTTRGKIVLAGF